VWWCTLVILALRRLRQVDQEWEATAYFKTTTTTHHVGKNGCQYQLLRSATPANASGIKYWLNKYIGIKIYM
jgi:hypothetical protein